MTEFRMPPKPVVPERAYRYEFEVPAAAVDVNGHANNVVYVQWMQDVAVRHFTEAGGTKITHDIGAGWVVRAHKIEYKHPAFEGERIVAWTWIVDFRRVRSTRRYRFARASDGEVLADGETDWVFVDAQTGRPRTIPSSITSLFFET